MVTVHTNYVGLFLLNSSTLISPSLSLSLSLLISSTAAPNYYAAYHDTAFNYCLNGWSGYFDPRAPIGPASGAYSTNNPGGTGRHSHHGNPGPSNGGHNQGVAGNISNSNSSGLNNGRNNRSLWTPNGVLNGATHSINGPSNGAGDKGHKNWNRNRSKNAARTGAGDSAGNS